MRAAILLSMLLTTPALAYTLDVTAVNGSVVLSPPGGTYDPGTIVTLTATPDSGYLFQKWTNDITGPNNPVTLTMTGNKTVTANFEVGYLVTISATNGSVTKWPSQTRYASGSRVILIPVPSVGYMFSGWSGSIESKRLATEITVTSNMSITASFTTWASPLGLPTPPIGITETYRMYDMPGNRNGSLTYSASDDGGYYTHYIDKDDPASTDTANSYGTKAKPRKSLPSMSNILPGSVVEIHAASTAYTGNWNITCAGTAAQPIFFRGATNDRPRITNSTYGRGSYFIMEGLEYYSGTLAIRFITGDTGNGPHHIAVRNCELWHCTWTPLYPVAYTAGKTASNIVFYANTVHPDNMTPPGSGTETDNVCIGILDRAEYIWVLDNHLYGAAGDAVAAGHGVDYRAHHWYIGRNVMHDCSENGIDLKEVNYMVCSQNSIFNMAGGTSGQLDGVPLVLHEGPNDAPKNTYAIFNDIWNWNGAAIQMSGDCLDPAWFIGNAIHDGTNERFLPYELERYTETVPYLWQCLRLKNYIDADGTVDPGFTALDNEFKGWIGTGSTELAPLQSRLLAVKASAGTAQAWRTWACKAVYFVDNTVWDVDNGFDWDPPSGTLTYSGNIMSHLFDDGFHMKMSRSYSSAVIQNSLFHRPTGNLDINWNGTHYTTIAAFQKATGKGAGCLYDDPDFADHDHDTVAIAASSPCIDGSVENAVYDAYFAVWGVSIKKDFYLNERPIADDWDIGACCYIPEPPEPNDDPGKVSVTNYAEHSTGIAVTINLLWEAPANTTYYKVYFADHTPLVDGDLVGSPSNLRQLVYGSAYSTTYYWRVDSYNATAHTHGDENSFTTMNRPLTPWRAVRTGGKLLIRK